MRNRESFDMSQRLLEAAPAPRGELPARIRRQPAPEPQQDVAPRLVPRPRAARMYLVSGSRGGGFAEVTITHP